VPNPSAKIAAEAMRPARVDDNARTATPIAMTARLGRKIRR
jgi:hypothetical protein